jgi:hypothetical protein
MFDTKLAVIGPTVTRWFGIARTCADCAASNPSAIATCRGFGSGCLGARESHPADTGKKITPYIPA